MISKIKKKLTSMSENDKNIFKNALGAFAVKGLSLVVSLFTMPAYLKFFNNEIALGLWFTVLSMLNWMLNFDLGIGNGLRNHLTKTMAQKDDEEAKRYVSSAYITIGGVAIAVSVVCVIAIQFVNWNTVFNISTEIVSAKALLLAVEIIFIGIMLQLVLRMITSILYAMQKSSINNFISLISTVLTLIAVLVIPSSNNDDNMIVMAIVHALAVAIPLIVATIVVFLTKRMRPLSPSIKCVTKNHSRAVLSLGGTFFFLQILYMVLVNTNEYLITMFTGNEFVVDYQIYYKWFTLGGTLFNLVMTPIWSAVTKALAEKNIKWIKKLYKKLLLLIGLATVCEFMIVPILQILINIWLREDAIKVNYLYALCFAVYGSLMIFNSAVSSIACGMEKLKTQAIWYIVGTAIKIPLAWLFVKITGSWIGIMIAASISLALYCIAQPISFRRLFREEQNNEIVDKI